MRRSSRCASSAGGASERQAGHVGLVIEECHRVAALRGPERVEQDRGMRVHGVYAGPFRGRAFRLRPAAWSTANEST